MSITVKSSVLRDTLGSAMQTVEQTGERITITRHGKPAAALVPPADLAVLEELGGYGEDVGMEKVVDTMEGAESQGVA